MIEIDILILAAGEGARFGSTKQLARLNGKPLLEHAISTASEVAKHLCSRPKPDVVSAHITVALGAHAEALQSECSEQLKSVGICHVTDWQNGISHSIRAGVHHIAEERKLSGCASKGILMLLADQPLIRSEDLFALVERAIDKNQNTCAEYEGSRGVPAFFHDRYWQALCSLHADKGAKFLLESQPSITLNVAGVQHDVDTPEQLASIARGLNLQ